MSFCKCGGYLGSGGLDMYSGRWCRCANPQMIHIPSVTADSVLINNPPKLKSCDNCGEKDARIKELEAEVEYQKNSATNFCKQSQAKNEIIDQLKEREKKLIQCVRFYADKENWDCEHSREFCEIIYFLLKDTNGELARETLKELGINNE